MNRFGLLGEHLAHSYSPSIHKELGDYEYCLYEKRPRQVGDFLLHDDFDGLNVTIPFKKTVIPFCAELSETAQAIGSVNTLIRRPPDGSLHGDNTDYYGLAYLINKAEVSPKQGKTIILGSGGSSLTAQAVLGDMGAGEVFVVSRTGVDNYGNIEKHGDAVLIINTTPVGMYPNNGHSPIADLGAFPKCRAVIDLIYNPSRTELLLQAEERGIASINGLAMLVAQAKRSAELFTSLPIPDERIEEIIQKIDRMTCNIVLIGMPGCGKTTTGLALAEMTGRKFIDTDDLIIKSAGKSIEAIFAQDGEDAFRAYETDILQDICKQTGLIIATGGGVVKRAKNRRIIRQNGVIVFLDRDASELPVTGRPLSQRDGISALMAERLPFYKKWSEHTVAVRGVAQTAEKIRDLVGI